MKKPDLKTQIENLEREIALYQMRKNPRMERICRAKLETLRQTYIEECMKYYEQSNIAT